MSKRRSKGDGGIYQRHNHPSCPPPDTTGERPPHTCRGTWVGAVDLGWVGGRRVRRTVTAPTRRALTPKLAKLKKEVDAGVDPEGWTVTGWLDYWLTNVVAPYRAPRTVTTYRGYIDQWITPALGRQRLGAVRASDVAALLDHMATAGKAQRTRQQAYAILHAAYEVAVRRQLVLDNPVGRITRPQTKGQEPHQALTVTEGRTLLDWAPTSADRARWALALLAGLRQGEALGLDWANVHVDDAQPWLFICQQRLRLKGQGVVTLPGTKSGPARAVAMLPELAAALTDYRHEHGGVGLLFPGLTPERDNGLFKSACRDAGVTVATLHGCRTTANELLQTELGVHSRIASDMLGHATTQVTDTHYHRASVEGQSVALRRALGESTRG